MQLYSVRYSRQVRQPTLKLLVALLVFLAPVSSLRSAFGGNLASNGDAIDEHALFRAVGAMYGLDPDLFGAIAIVESHNDSRAISSKGAMGLMQLMPATVSRFKVADPFDPIESALGAARLLGFTHWQAITREVLPATLPLLITLMSLEMAIAVVVEAILSFVGLGVGANQPAWGQMIADARQYVYQSPWNLLLPALAIFLTVTSFNLLGDGLRRTLDVRLAENGR